MSFQVIEGCNACIESPLPTLANFLQGSLSKNLTDRSIDCEVIGMPGFADIGIMEDGGLSFDFEGGSEEPATTVNPSDYNDTSVLVQPTPRTEQARKQNFRQTVCRHWLRGLCMKGEACEFLHQFDKSRMPVCQFFAKFGECYQPDCAFKHSIEDVKECQMYKLGFCPRGPYCRYVHIKLPGPPPSFEQNMQKMQRRVYASGSQFNARQ